MRILAGIGTARDIETVAKFVDAVRKPIQLVLIGVVPELSLFSFANSQTTSGRKTQRSVNELERAAAQSLLESAVRVLSRPGRDVEFLIEHGDPAARIITAIRDLQCDVVLVTRRAARDSSAKRLSTVAARLARFAPAHVAILDERVASYRKFVLAADGSPEATRSADVLRDLGIGSENEVVVCTVVHGLEPAFLPTGSLSYDDYKRITLETAANERKAGEKIAGQVAADLRAVFGRVGSSVRFGAASEEILSLARDTGADLIVIGTKSRRRIAPFKLGSVSARIADEANTSLLITR